MQLKEASIKLRNKMTEKDYNPERRNKKIVAGNISENAVKTPIKKEEKKEGIKNIDEKKTEEKKPLQKKPFVKKSEAVTRGTSLPISTRDSIAICRFIKHKTIKDAIADLEQVVIKKKAVPMKGEIPHRKGKIMAGRFPKKASEHFIILLKTLSANANVNGLENPVIVEAVANQASRPYGRFGRVQRKRSHIQIKCMEKNKK